LDLFDFIDLASHKEDKTYNKIVRNWNEFINCLPGEDKQLLFGIMSKCYFKYQKSIKVYGISDYELYTALLMFILIDQQIQIDVIIAVSYAPSNYGLYDSHNL
jgi:hypothetical protein